jgi:phospholipid/cholesterol/gamma-HCH transport system substrate-binding protein
MGIFISAGVLIFIIAIYLIGAKQNMFGINVKVSTVFMDVKGLRQGATVRFTGIDVGAVSNLEIMSDSTVLVEMAIEQKVTPFIKKNSIATIGTQGLMGNKLIVLLPGSPDESSIAQGDTLPSLAAIETDDILKEIYVSSERISEVSGNLVDITDKINRGEGIFGKIFTDTSFAYNLSRTSQNLAELSNMVNRGEGFVGKLLADTSFSGELDSAAHYISEISRNLESVTGKLDKGEGILGRMFTDTLVAQNLYNSSLSLNETTGNLEKITGNLIGFSETLNTGEGAVQKMLVDSVFADSLDIVLRNLNETLIEVRKASEAVQRSGMIRMFSKNKKPTEGTKGEDIELPPEENR